MLSLNNTLIGVYNFHKLLLTAVSFLKNYSYFASPLTIAFLYEQPLSVLTGKGFL